MNHEDTLSQEYLKRILNYNEKTGEFEWKRRGSGIRVGKKAGGVDSYGYVRIRIDGIRYRAHRLVFLYVFGFFPKEEVDHINHDKSDNRLSNLRLCSRSENFSYRKKPVTNSSGYKGVSFKARNRKWVAQIGKGGKRIHLGLFNSKEEAYLAYCLKAKELFGEFFHPG